MISVIDCHRASPAEFVVPLAKYNKALYSQVSLGMRFRMMFETEECGVRRYMGTITGISDLDPLRWKNSQWRNLQVLLNLQKEKIVAIAVTVAMSWTWHLMVLQLVSLTSLFEFLTSKIHFIVIYQVFLNLYLN